MSNFILGLLIGLTVGALAVIFLIIYFGAKMVERQKREGERRLHQFKDSYEKRKVADAERELAKRRPKPCGKGDALN